MAENLDDGEFWLPPQFLADDDGDMEKSTSSKSRNASFGPYSEGDAARGLFLYGFGSHGISSDLSSPVESLVGSSETESDEEEQHIAELTRKLAHSTLCDDFGSEKPKGAFLSGSPQSTLCTFGSGCGCRKGSSNGSPNSICQIASQTATWDLLHAAAEEVERMRLSEEGYGGFNHHRGLLGPPRKPSPPLTALPVKNTNPDLGFYTQQSLSHQQLQIAQFQILRQQQMLKQQQQQNNSAVWGGGQANKVDAAVVANGLCQQKQSNHHMIQNNGVGRNNNRSLGLSSSAWPTLRQAKQQQNQQQQFGSGMRAVFLGNPAGRRESAGTGVFLPRCVDNPADSKRKPACSTVLVPARVAQALNLKMEDMMGGQLQYQPRFNGALNLNLENDVAVHHRVRSNGGYPQQKRNQRLQPPVNHHEIRLPQDWTY